MIRSFPKLNRFRTRNSNDSGRGTAARESRSFELRSGMTLLELMLVVTIMVVVRRFRFLRFNELLLVKHWTRELTAFAMQWDRLASRQFAMVKNMRSSFCRADLMLALHHFQSLKSKRLGPRSETETELKRLTVTLRTICFRVESSLSVAISVKMHAQRAWLAILDQVAEVLCRFCFTQTAHLRMRSLLWRTKEKSAGGSASRADRNRQKGKKRFW